jgi:predicted membrane channel-forming protein YqfA (hemolysin III family)
MKRREMNGRAWALLALAVSLGTVAAFVVLLQMLLIPLGPVWYLSALACAVVLAAVAVAQSRGWLTMSALVVSVLLFALGGVFNFVLMRVPTTPSAFVVGRPAPDFTPAGGARVLSRLLVTVLRRRAPRSWSRDARSRSGGGCDPRHQP